MKPIYFDDDQRQELEHILGKNMTSTRELIIQVRNAVAVRVNNLKITLKPGLLARLKSRCLPFRWPK